MVVNIKFIEDGEVTEVAANAGQSVLEVVNEHEINLDCICQGCLACSTCHVVLSKADYEKTCKTSPISEEETDLLDMARGLTKTSRLSCQIKLTEEMEGMVLNIPTKE